MIKLENISKNYQIKKNKYIIKAIDNVALTFPSKGLNSIVGPSGCGKSTLLNILGGLEIPTSGKFYVNDKLMEINSKKYNEMYRNQYISFIFQDFNLINDITVFENLSLVSFTSEVSTKEKVSRVLSDVGLFGYEDRYPTELSGGEVQRVAIARALMKNTPILLADEPTGNLNSQMSIEVFELLKKISNNTLVVIATHNVELANLYSDRIINLKDGKVLTDSNQGKNIDEQKFEVIEKENTLNNKITFKMVFNNLIKYKFETITFLLLLLMSFMSIFISFAYVDYNRQDVDVKNLSFTKEEYFSISYFNNNSKIKSSVIEEITKSKITYINNNYVVNYEDLQKMGYNFYDNYLPLNDDGIYVSDIFIRYAIDNARIYRDYLLSNLVLKEELNYANLSGTYYLERNEILNTETVYKICGIYKSQNNTLNNENSNLLSKDKQNFYDLYYNKVFFKKAGIYDKNHRNVSVEITSDTSTKEGFRIDFLENNQEKTFSNLNYQFMNELHYGVNGNWDLVLTKEGLRVSKYKNIFSDSDEEGIYISLPLYNLLFNEHSNQNYYISDKYFDPIASDYKWDILRYPTNLGKEISFKISDNLNDYYKVEYANLKIKGVILSSFNATTSNIILLSNNKYNSIFDLTRDNNILIKNDLTNHREFVEKLYNGLNLYPLYPQSNFINDFEIDSSNTRDVFLIIFIFLTISVILIDTYFIKRTIKRRSREIGILKSIGIKNIDIIKIYVFQISIISIILIISILLSTIMIIDKINFIIIKDYTTNLYILFYKSWYLPATIIFIILINIFSLLFIINNIIKRNSIEVIRHS